MNFALRVLKPVLDGSAASVEPKLSAEDEYIRQVQAACQNTVWHSGGCNSVGTIVLLSGYTSNVVQWYINDKKWNATAYPWAQAHFWYRCLFPTWKDWNINVSFLCVVVQMGVLTRKQWVQKPASSGRKRLLFVISLIIWAGLYNKRLNGHGLAGIRQMVGELRKRVGY